ncbi:HTH_Tnp_Tc3_2 domain-containing protein [Trichonephila clavipes]|nr:HTH_Tnp_Tc3_2 domain-containing protein [Trichonephila clavipes]
MQPRRRAPKDHVDERILMFFRRKERRNERKDSGLPRYCGLSFRKIDSHVGRNETTAMRISDRWMQEGTMDGRGRSHPPQRTTSRKDKQIVRMAVTDRSVKSRTVAQHIASVTHHSTTNGAMKEGCGCRME